MAVSSPHSERFCQGCLIYQRTNPQCSRDKGSEYRLGQRQWRGKRGRAVPYYTKADLAVRIAACTLHLRYSTIRFESVTVQICDPNETDERVREGTDLLATRRHTTT